MRAAYDPAPRRPLTRGERLIAVCFGLLLFGLWVAEVVSDFSPRKLSVLMIVAFWVPLLVVHELGHALTARAVGFRVYEIVIGFGPELARFSALGARVTLRLLPLEGYVVPAPTVLSGARQKTALTYAGGPAAELAIALLVLAAIGPERLFSRSDELGLLAAQSLALAAVLGVLMTLLPHAAGGSASDGLGILLSFRLNERDFSLRMARPVMDEAERRIDNDEPEAALALTLRALREDPDNPFLALLHTRCMAATGQHEAAVQELERLQALPGVDDLLEAERLLAAARVVLEADDRAHLPDAEDACRAALERAPGHRDLQLTLAGVLIARNRYREAEELTRGVFRATREPLLEDRCLAYLAVTARALGRPDDYTRFRDAFEERNPSRRLRRLLESGAA